MIFKTVAAKRVAEIPVADIADYADASIDNHEARDFFIKIRTNLANAIEESGGVKPDSGTLLMVVEGAQSVYDGTLLLQSLGTGAHREECEMCLSHSSMIEYAEHTLYQMAERAVGGMLVDVFLDEDED